MWFFSSQVLSYNRALHSIVKKYISFVLEIKPIQLGLSTTHHQCQQDVKVKKKTTALYKTNSPFIWNLTWMIKPDIFSQYIWEKCVTCRLQVAEATTGVVLLKKVFLDISKDLKESTCARISFLIKFNKLEETRKKLM